MTHYYIDENIKNTERIFPQQGRYTYHRYDLNENPEGLPKSFVDSVLQNVTPEFLSTYPEPDTFLHKYAKHIGAEFENVLSTNGSDMAIRYILETFGEPEKEVVTVAPSFEMYWVNCKLLGLKHVPVAYESDWTIKVENIIAAISKNTRVVVLLNPNNPIGNVYSTAEMQAVVQRASEVGAVVIIDEAYHYFYPDTFIEQALKADNVIVLRTFSKLFSLAACRLGVIISNPKIIHYIKNGLLSFENNAFALLFAEKILDCPEMVEELIRVEEEGKQHTLDSLTAHGYTVHSCKGNFIFVKPKHDANRVSRLLKEEKQVLVHPPYGNPLLKDYIRVSVGSANSMDIFLKAFYDVDAE